MTVSYTLGQLTDDCLRQLRGTTRDMINVLSQAMTAPPAGTIQTIFLTTNLNGVTIGSLLAVGAETMYVLETYPTTVSCQVIRGYDDTTPAIAAAGAVVAIDPPWPRKLVQERIRDEIRSSARRCSRCSTSIPDCDVAARLRPRRHHRHHQDPARHREQRHLLAWGVDNHGLNAIHIEQANPDYPFKYMANANPLEFPSGRSLTLTGPSLPIQVGNLHVVYAAASTSTTRGLRPPT